MPDIGGITAITSTQGGLSFSPLRERGPIQAVGSTGGGGPALIPPPVVTGPVTKHKMVAKDTDCGSPTLRTWIVEGTPDLVGAQYTGARCGVTPFSGGYVAATWQELSMRYGYGLNQQTRLRKAWSPNNLTPGALSFLHDMRIAAPRAVGGGAISDGALVGSYPGRAGTPTLASASGHEPTYWAGRRGGRAIIQNAEGKWMVGASAVAFERIFIVAEGRWPETVRGPNAYPPLFPPSAYTGLASINSPTVPAVLAGGWAGSNRLLYPEDFGGLPITEARIDGVAVAGLDMGTLDRVLRVYEFRRASGWSGGLVLGDDRNLGLALRQWPGGIAAAAGLTGTATATDRDNLRSWLLLYAQQGSCVGFIGDSITAGYGRLLSQSFRGLLHAYYKATVGCPTVSIPGATIPQLLATSFTAFDATLARSANPVVVIDVATNDIATSSYLVNGGSEATAFTNLAALIAARRAAIGSKLKVIATTLTARNDLANLAAGGVSRMQAFNVLLRASGASIGIDTLVDLATLTLVGFPYNAAGFDDAIHPSIAGHNEIFGALRPAIEAYLPALG